jgi:RED-like protein N-terminal region
MTPRSVAGYSSSNDLARQVAEHKRALLNEGQPAPKKFRSRAAPKGTKLSVGYQDRAALLRQQEAEGVDGSDVSGQNGRAERIKALEEMVKLQQIDQDSFEKLKDEIGIGGDLGSTHLVKGLDRKLLERVRRGEDVRSTDEITNTKEVEGATRDESGRQDVDEELESMLEKEVKAADKEQRVKKGQMAAPSSTLSAEKMSRDEILKRLKAGRIAAAREVKENKSAEPSLGAKFRKLGADSKSQRKKIVETVDGRRREVLLVTDPDGTTKRKVRWIDKEDVKPEVQSAAAKGEALGMEVPAELAAKQKAMLAKRKLEEEEDNDIFAGVGAEYDPFGDIADESGDDLHSEETGEAAATEVETEAATEATIEVKTGQIASKPRNYFGSSPTTAPDETKSKAAPLADPAILAALKRAAAVRKAQEDADPGNEAHGTDTTPHSQDFLARLRKREREDAADLDLGFGESRFGDEEDEEGPIWNGEEGGKQSERKRGPKKRKGNKDNVKDVMVMMERGKKS